MKLTVTIPELKTKTLYEAIQDQGSDSEGMDIDDIDWDWSVYVACPKNWNWCKTDAYDQFCLLFCLNTEYDPEKGSCNVTGFIDQHRDAIDRFLNEVNRDSPKYYYSMGNMLRSDEDNGFFEVYMESLEDLLIGNYSNTDYELLVKYLMKDADPAEKEGLVNMGVTLAE